MKSILLVFTCILVYTLSGFSQAPYFQQRLQVKIQASLNDVRHELQGTAEFVYINQAPVSLDTIYFHLWANAYSNKTSAFTKDKLSSRNTNFYFAEKELMGGYKDLDFKIEGKSVPWGYVDASKEVAWVKLPQPLATQKSAMIEIPFLLKIPGSFSRLGHVGGSYQMTQWYPKPAVLDQDGWHLMPYLDQGEFYSEFGTYDVSLTLPKNYVVAATGTLQTAAEKVFLIEKIKQTESLREKGFDTSLDFPESDPELKTIRYTAENVHDFAWFADKRFHVLKEDVDLITGKWVEAYAFFTNEEANLWTKGAQYVKRALQFYSENVGEYPYPHATAVQSALSAGAGMEYPMITVIGRANNARALDRVITHEVGHNWFYGILASNERDNPWLDEGLNTFYENRYMRTYYNNDDELAEVPEFFRKGSKTSGNEITELFQSRPHFDQPPGSHSADFVFINYGLDVYMKTGKALRLVEQYLGKETFDDRMKRYYDTWKFKHPRPEDFRAILTQGGKNLDWFFDGLIYSNKKTDYAIKGIERNPGAYAVHIKNKESLATPFSLTAFKQKEVVCTQWFEGISDQQTVDLLCAEADEIVLDSGHYTFDLYRKDNQIKTTGAFPKMEPLEVVFLGKIENPEKTRINWLPVLGWNNYDKFQLGASIYSFPVPDQKFEYYIAGLYGFGSGNPNFVSNLRYQNFFRTGFIQRLAFDLNLKRFSYAFSDTYNQEDHFTKIAPQITIDFRKSRPASPIHHSLAFISNHIRQDYVSGINADSGLFDRVDQSYYVNQLRYDVTGSDILRPFKGEFQVQQGDGFVKLFGHFQQRFVFAKKGKAFTIRAFGGWMNQDNKPKNIPPNIRFQTAGQTGGNLFQRDYLFNEILLGRNEDEGWLSQQVFDQDGSLKTIGSISGSSDWMLGMGLRSGVPNPLPIEPYMDLVLRPEVFKTGNKLSYSGGVALVLIRDIFEIYFPLLESDDIRKSNRYLSNPGFFQRCTFKLNLKELNPHSAVQKIRKLL